jgi:hypothetical protein
VLKILREDFLQAVVFRVRSEVCVEPAQLVCRAAANGLAENRLIRVQNRELFQKLFRLPQRVGLFEDSVASNRARHGRDAIARRIDPAIVATKSSEFLTPASSKMEVARKRSDLRARIRECRTWRCHRSA